MPLTRPEVSRLAELVYRQLSPLSFDDVERDWSLLILDEGIIGRLAEIDDLARDSDDGPGWSAAVDIDRAPERLLSWLAQFVGVKTRQGMAEEVYRAYIKDMPGTRRGTPASLVTAAKRNLIGDQRVTLKERDGSAYALTVVTYTAETPDEPAVLAAILEQKPAGLVLTYTVNPGWTYGEAAEFYVDNPPNTYAAMAGDFADYDALRANLP